MNLKKISDEFRAKILKRNLKTPPDQVANITNLGLSITQYLDALGRPTIIGDRPVTETGTIEGMSPKYLNKLLKKNQAQVNDITDNISNVNLSSSIYRTYIDSRGRATNINDFSVKNEGDVTTNANKYRNTSLSRNKTLRAGDPSESDQYLYGDTYNFSSLLAELGSEAVINDYIVPNQGSVSQDPFSTQELERVLNLTSNKYVPRILNTYEANIRQLHNDLGQSPYVDLNTSSLFGYDPQKLDAFEIYNLQRTSIAEILAGRSRLLQSDTMLANIAAQQLKFAIEERVKQQLISESLGKVNLYDATHNPSTLAKLIKDPKNNIIEKNYSITVGGNPMTKAADFLARLSGVQSPVNLIPDIRKDLRVMCDVPEPSAESLRSGVSRIYRDATGKSLRDQRDAYHLKYTGAGQKNILYQNLGMNKYRPNYIPEYESGLVAGLDKVRDQIANVSQWVGGSGQRPVQNYYLGNSENDPIFALQDEQGYQVRSNEYLTRLWIEKQSDSTTGKLTYDEPAAGSYGDLVGDLIWAVGDEDELQGKVFGQDITRKFSSSGELDFKECSLLDRTSKLLAKGGSNQAISQVRSKFTDGDYTYSKGSAVKNVNRRLNSSETANVYEITDEYCRTWTKIRPHSKIGDLMKYQGLLRKERNSVISGNGNYSIYPTVLNVNDGYGKYDSEQNPYVGQTTARKYMLSIENLAWKGSDMYQDLPDCERGPNGGRVMWFPPYDVNATETSTSNITTNSFLGRPEPVYTYNNTERTGSLSFKIVVDHPSIMNILVKKELAAYSEKEVDEIIDAFWSGCLEFDIYQLARIWGVFSISELEYFKKVIEEINGAAPNSVIENSAPVVNTVGSKNEENTTVDIMNTPTLTQIQNKLTTNYFFFENDEPLTDDSPDFGTLFEQYKSLATGDGEYSRTLGANVPSEYAYFTTSSDMVLYKGFEDQYNTIKNNFEQLISETKGRSLKISLKAYTSSLAPTDYNKKLALRRFASVGKWLAINYGCTNTGEKYTIKTVDDIINPDDFNTIKFKKFGLNNTFDEVELTAEETKELTVAEMLAAVGADTTYDQVYYHDDNKVVTCTASDFESTDPDKLVCSVYSIPASVARRVEITSIDYSTFTDIDTTFDVNTNNINNDNQTSTVSKRRYTNLTKRDIAQRLLGKIVNECSYFEYLESETPIIYKSLKEKLKYFHPTFHSMTPEGLNSRLTFLQQCLRSGDTIKVVGSSGTTNSCDAPNTSFGKPPVCVLRIGDFYHSRIIIDGLTIDYDGPMTFDLNPEGIGAQPMLANVTLSFKFIGGQGLRGPVKQLQNALSFNYYANTEIYDGRSYANTNEFERNLQQYETDDTTGELFLSQIVSSAEEIKGSNKPLTASTDTIGERVSLNDIEFASGRTYYVSEYGESDIVTENINYKGVYSEMYQDYRKYINDYVNYQDMLLNNSHDFVLNNLVFFNNDSHGQVKPSEVVIPASSSSLPQYYTNVSVQKSYYQSGIDQHEVLSSVTNGRLGVQQIRPNLMVQEGLDKLTSGSGNQTHPTNPLVTTLTNYNGFVIPKPIDSDNVDALITKYRDLFMNRVEYGLLTIIRSSDKTISNDLSIKYDTLLSTHKNKFRTYIGSKLDEYLNQYKTTGTGEYTSYEEFKNNSNKLYNKVIYDVDKISVITSGIDSGIGNEGRTYYEVVPSGLTLSTEISTLFGYEPYKEVELIGKDASNVRQVISVSDINSVSSSNMNMLGYFDYFANQYLSGRSGLANTHNLPEYISVSDAWSSNGGEITIPVDYSMNKVFEKINYEFYQFTNRTIEVMNYDDSPRANKFLNLQLIKQNTELDLNSLSTEVSSDVHSKIIAMYFGEGNNVEYKIAEHRKTLTGEYTNKGIGIDELNNIFKVKYVINSELNKRKSSEFVGMSGTTYPNLTNYSCEFSVGEEMIFLGFYNWIKDTIAEDLKTIFSDVKITRTSVKGSDAKLKKVADDFANGLPLAINRLILKVYPTISRANQYNRDKLTSFKGLLNVDSDFKTIGNDVDYTLKMRKTKTPHSYGKILYQAYQKVSAYWAQFPE